MNELKSVREVKKNLRDIRDDIIILLINTLSEPSFEKKARILALKRLMEYIKMSSPQERWKIYLMLKRAYNDLTDSRIPSLGDLAQLHQKMVLVFMRLKRRDPKEYEKVMSESRGETQRMSTKVGALTSDNIKLTKEEKEPEDELEAQLKKGENKKEWEKIFEENENLIEEFKCWLKEKGLQQSDMHIYNVTFLIDHLALKEKRAWDIDEEVLTYFIYNYYIRKAEFSRTVMNELLISISKFYDFLVKRGYITWDIPFIFAICKDKKKYLHCLDEFEYKILNLSGKEWGDLIKQTRSKLLD